MSALKLALVATLMASVPALKGVTAFAAEPQPVIGLITKTETNPFFVEMRRGAEAEAKARGVRLITGAGRRDGDNAGQVTAMENMTAAGAKTLVLNHFVPADAPKITEKDWIDGVRETYQGDLVVSHDLMTINL